jgi:hypothetical protein
MKKVVGLPLLITVLLFSQDSFAQFFTSLKAPLAPGERFASAVVDLRGLSVSQVRISVVYGTDSLAVANAFDPNRKDPSKYFESGTSQVGAVIDGKVEAVVIFPHSGKPVLNSRERVFPRGTKIFYSWARTHTPTGATSELTISNARVLSFVMPRPLTIALLGDSYASGEGAKGTAWLNEPCHRSANGGGELAIRKLKTDRKRFEIDYINVTCSGAKLTDFYQNAQLKDESNPGAGTKQGLQIDLVSSWLRTKGYDAIDILMADGGGNDLGFGDVVVQGLTSVFSEFSGDQELMTRVQAAFNRLPDNYMLFKTYLESKISVGRVVWFNYPNAITGNPLPGGGFDANLCKPGIVSDKRLCWTAENNLNEKDWKFIYDKFLVPLNQAVATAASLHGWDFVDISNEAIRNGICNCDGYINSLTQSVARQGDQYGTMHPNATGFREIYRDRLYNQLLASITKVHTEFIADAKAGAIAAAKERARAEMEYKARTSTLTSILSVQTQLTNSLLKYRVIFNPIKFNIDPSTLQKIIINN